MATQVNMTATNGDASADSSNVGKVTLIAGGDGEVSAFDALTANMATGGDADLLCYGSAQVMVIAGGDATLTTGGWLAGSAKAAGDIDALSMGEISGEFDAGWDASVVSAADIATATITAGHDASAVGWGGAEGLDLEGANDAYAFGYGGLGGTVESSAGTAEAFSAGTAVLTLNAATTATFNGLGDADLQVNSGGDADIFAAGLLSGFITAGQDVFATSYGLFKANVNATRDATVSSVGDMDTSVTAGRNLWAISYGALNADPFSAGQNIVFVGAVGDITGTIHAENVIQRIATYAAINNATISAGPTSPLPPGEGQGEGGSIWLIEAYGDITGNISASSDVALVRSRHDITATVSAPSVGTIDRFDPLVMTDYPATPSTSLASIWAELADGYGVVLAAKADMAADALAQSLALPAGEAAAFAAFQPSMGTPGEAQAAMQSAVNQLNGSVGQITYAVAQAYIGASIAHHSMWMAISSGEASAQAAFTSQMHQLGIQMDQAAADFTERAAAAALVGLMAEDAAATNHLAALSSWAVASATKRPEDLASAEQSLLFERLHGAFFVAGVTIGWAPVVGDALDLTESALYFYEGNNFDGWMNVAFAIARIIHEVIAGLAKSRVAVKG